VVRPNVERQQNPPGISATDSDRGVDATALVIAKLKESDIRRDERDKTLKEMAGQIQTNTRWYVLAGVAIAGPTAVLLERLL